jgi:hypothetical protein
MPSAAGKPSATPRKAAPPLAELRRRATQRLRQIACLLAIVRAEYDAAAAECERLDAAGPTADVQLALDGEAAEQLAARFAALKDKPKQMESALAAAHDRNRELQARLAHLERGEGRRSAPPAEAPARHQTTTSQTDTEDLLRFIDELADMLPLPPGRE